jgi:hypothetical protein
MDIELYVPDKDKPQAIIVDIDGTLAHHDRHHHDYSDVSTDTVDPIIRDLVDREWASGYDILVVTGRPLTCYWQTYKWLTDNHVPVDDLWMRDPKDVDEQGNKIQDWIVKLSLFNTHIRNNYNVEYVLEDRVQCVEMWRKLGLKCLQVEEGNF